MEIVARVHGKGHSDYYRGEGLRQSEMKKFTSLLPGLPVTLEHNNNAVSGVVTGSRLAPDGTPWVKIKTRNTPQGRIAEHHVENKGYRSVSMGTHLTMTSDLTAVKRIVPFHIALVQKPGFDGADVLGIRKGNQVYVKQSQFNIKPNAMSTTSEQPGVNRDVSNVADDPLAAMRAKLEMQQKQIDEQTAELAKREADVKAKAATMTAKEQADKDAQIEKLKAMVKAQETKNLLIETAADKKDALGAATDLFEMTQNPNNNRVIQAFASAGKEYGNIKKIKLGLETKLAEALAANEKLQKQVTSGSRRMDNEDRFPSDKAAFLAEFGGEAPQQQQVTLLGSGDEPSEEELFFREMQATVKNYTGTDLLVEGSVDDLARKVASHKRSR
jgi:hypothetical protein